MEDGFELSVTYNGKELLFPAQLIRFGYAYRIQVDVNGVMVSFERDEERNWRALIDTTYINNNNINKDILAVIAETLVNF